MKKRLLSLFLAFVTLLGILPTAALAANTEEEALGEVDIYNGGYELSYLTINGRIRTQDYTYFNYVDAKGQKKEVPAYCVNPNIKGVPQTVGVGESIKYLANERSSDPKVVGIISNGYPHRSLGELKLDNKYQAYYATKMALWCYLLPNWNIANLKVAPGLTGSELDIGNRILAAAKDIYKRGTTYNYMLEPRMTATPDKSAAYSVTVDGKQYKQQVFTIWSETWVYDYDMEMLRREIHTEVIQPALRELPPDEGTEILINPSGRFVLGGFEADTGLTGRKLMVDTYGGLAPHGGGALSGKDGSKVDRSGTYMARYIAKNIVAAGLAEKCTVSLAYAIGKADPVAVDIDTHGSGEYGDDVLAQAVRQVFELTPAGMIRTLGLDKPIFAQFCNYGHFTHQDAPWEQCDCADLLWNVCRVKEAGVSSR